MFNLLTGGASRPPFTDWLAQVERRINRKGLNVTFQHQPELRASLHSCYDVGLSPIEIADTWEEFSR
jgi:hypothetical protein